MRAAPGVGAERLGYLRVGQRVRRGAESVGHAGCPGGWYRVAPMGYVCVGDLASLSVDDSLHRLAPDGPDRDAPLPYPYAMTRSDGPPLYTRVPSAPERGEHESGPHARRHADWQGHLSPSTPVPLRNGGSLPSIHGYRHSSKTLYVTKAAPHSGYAFVDLFRSGAEAYGLNTDLLLMPLDRLEPVRPSTFTGLRLGAGEGLPVAFVVRRHAWVYGSSGPAGSLRPERRAHYREAFTMGTERRAAAGCAWRQTADGHWLKESELRIVEPATEMPQVASQGGAWIDVSLVDQALVAYEGAQPVFVTLVSTGRVDPSRPELETATREGLFRVHAKHVTATMAGDEPGAEYRMGDVPWVQYYDGSFALHAAYWHDGFGAPRSHGCVNLSPLDALWLFKWSRPSVPRAWYGANSKQGTWLRVRG